MRKRPNILYFVCHDIGKHMGSYGALVETPHLDRFAAEGVRFDSNFCNSTACSPSRACAMSGKYAHTTGAIGLSHMGWPLDLKHRTIIDYMNEAGYETILSGVNHERHPRSDRYEVDVTRSWEDWSADRDTIVIFTTDHGISNARSKGTLYQRGVEIALLVRMPDRSKAGTVIRHLTQKIDNTPIILEAVGAPVPAELQGRSYWPLLSGGDYAPHEAIFMERSFHGERPFPGVDGFIDQFDPVRAVRTMDFHYIRWFNPDLKARPLLPFEIKAETDRKGPIEEIGAPASREPRNAEELYHARHDPQEFVNVAGRPEYEKSAPLWRKGSSTGCEKRTTFSLAEKRRLAPRSAAGDRTGHSRIKTLQYS